VTITLDEDVARWARIRAAKDDTSVSRLVGDLLREHMRREEHYEEAMNRYLSLEPANISSGAPYPTREEMHARGRLR
jgi:plasmid stability protein